MPSDKPPVPEWVQELALEVFGGTDYPVMLPELPTANGGFDRRSDLEWKLGQSLPDNTIVRALAGAGATHVKIRRRFVVSWRAPKDSHATMYETEREILDNDRLREYDIDFHGEPEA